MWNKDGITNSNSFEFKGRFISDNNNCDIINAEIAAPLKYLKIFWKTLKQSLINCETNFILTWSSTCVNAGVKREIFLPITDSKLYLPVIRLSTQDNVKRLDQLKPGFKRSINWNKYQWNIAIQQQNQYLDYLMERNFQGVNCFITSRQYDWKRTHHLKKRYI